MENITELKAKGYDLISQYESLMNYAEQVKGMINENNNKIKKLVEIEKEAEPEETNTEK